MAFDSEADAYAHSMKKNRSWSAKFSWELDSSLAWVCVRQDALGRLRSHKPVGEPPPERLPVGEEPKTGLAPARGKRKRDEGEDVLDDAEDADDEDADGEDGHPDEDEAGQMMLALG